MVIKSPSGEYPTPDFYRYPDREVLCLGVPYPGSKLVEGVWYFQHVNGDYFRFPLQGKVQEVVVLEHQPMLDAMAAAATPIRAAVGIG